MAWLEGYELTIEVTGLLVLLVMSGLFSISETSMMALNRYRLRHLVSEGHGGAKRAAALLRRTDRLLGAILIGNNFVNIAAATLASLIAVDLLGQGKVAYAVSTVATTFVLVVFAEIVPKVIGATYPERVALPLAYVLGPLQRILAPVVWFMYLFARPLLRLAGVRPDANQEAPRLTPPEIRTLVLESSRFMPKKHVSILLNLFDLGNITVQDIMAPRAKIESIKLDDDMATIARQLSTSYHMRLPVYRSSMGEVAGIIHLRKVLGLLHAGELDRGALEQRLTEPYFVPASTPVFAQLQYFQEKRERLALVVDEYGEVLGLVALEDIIEEMIGKFTTSLPSAAPALAWDDRGSVLAEGGMAVREVNRVLGLALPTDGPKTLNGLVLEHLQDIPEANVSLKIDGIPMEIVAAQGRVVKTVRLFRPPASSGPAEAD